MILLGSTGSIGINTLEVANALGIDIESMSAGRNIELFNTQIKVFKPKNICILEQSDSARIDNAFLKAHNIRLFCGEDGLLDMIEASHSSLAINAIVGFAGLAPSIKIMQTKKKLALANKESLVSGGWLFEEYPIMPIDSEHFGIWYLLQKTLQNSDSKHIIKKLIITASGGALRDIPLSELANVTKEQALRHPNWSMGNKITIDSATMMNKIFEALEAFWFFRTKNIDARIEKTSSIHALVEFVDGSICAHICAPNMKLPISYALAGHKAQNTSFIEPLNLDKFCNISLEKIDVLRYKVWDFKEKILESPKLGVVLNASNEIAVHAFLQNKITFKDITRVIIDALNNFDSIKNNALNSFEEIRQIDEEVRKFTDLAIKAQ